MGLCKLIEMQGKDVMPEGSFLMISVLKSDGEFSANVSLTTHEEEKFTYLFYDRQMPNHEEFKDETDIWNRISIESMESEKNETLASASWQGG